MSSGTLDTEKFIEGLHDYLQREIGPLFKRVDELEKQMVDVKNKGVCFRGVYSEDKEYNRGDLVVRSGAMWACTGDNVTEQPPSHQWTLVSKSK